MLTISFCLPSFIVPWLPVLLFLPQCPEAADRLSMNSLTMFHPPDFAWEMAPILRVSYLTLVGELLLVHFHVMSTGSKPIVVSPAIRPSYQGIFLVVSVVAHLAVLVLGARPHA